MRILLVGGTGFIGRRAAMLLVGQGAQVRILDLPAAIDRFAALPGVQAMAGDATDAATLRAAAEGCDGIIHLAGIMTVDCAADPTRAVQINVMASLNVFQAAAGLRIPVAYLSTAGVFGPEDAHHPWPMTVYGVTKLAVEGLARVFAADHGLNTLGLRPYIVYGPGISSGIAAGPSVALAASVRQEPAVIGFSGRVGLVYVDDVARLLVSGVTRPLSGAHVLTIAGDTQDVADFVTELSRQTGWIGISVEGLPLRIPAELVSDPVPAALGAHPVTQLRDGIALSLRDLQAAG
ncbi:NAD-dependent epimerase/dehydratase family protein [Neotabrizicola sp. sgz301269]|uniref:NAD-dependent epimerase/dehydratase family protein n=1 Tax=Neotabrizicola sp. sgz301269 TaxID=3276282 RepID=UPI00376F7B8E